MYHFLHVITALQCLQSLCSSHVGVRVGVCCISQKDAVYLQDVMKRIGFFTDVFIAFYEVSAVLCDIE